MSRDIKIKSRVIVKRFIEKGLELQSGEILNTDLIVFAIGYQRDPRIQAATIVGNTVAKRMILSRGLDKNGELDRNMMPAGKCPFT